MKNIPFARILLPYLSGTVCLLQGVSLPHRPVFFGLTFLVLGTAFLSGRKQKQIRARRDLFFAIGFYSFLFGLPFAAARLYDARNSPDHYAHHVLRNGQLLIATISEMPVEKEKTLKLTVLMDAIAGNGEWHAVTGHVIVYVRQPVAKPLNAGEQVMLRAKLSSPAPPQNPGEADYRQVLERKNIFHTAYVPAEAIWLTGNRNSHWSLARVGLVIREYVVRALRAAGLTQEAFSICTALLVGYDDEISSGVMQSFSHSGTLHVLSVSGMHTGILYVVLTALCGLFDRHKRYPLIRAAFVLTALWLFVAVTGFSPSVLRAALMLTLVLIGTSFRRNGNAFNTLLVSAFLLLLYNPYLLADVGFLLSYLAVGGILYLYPLLNAYWQPENRLLKFFWDTSLMSVAATLFTLPVTLYYFHQFPLWFIVSNLIIIPLSTVLMGASFLLLLCAKVLFLKQALAWLINRITAVMLHTAQLTDQPAYGYIDAISFGPADVLFCSLFILLLLWFLSSKSYRALASCLLCAILWTGFSLSAIWCRSSETELVVFSVRHKAVSLLRTGGEAYLLADSLTDMEFGRCVKPYILGHPGLALHYSRPGAWHAGGKQVVTMADARTLPPGCDYLIVSHDALPDPQTLRQIKPLVIADCSNSYTFVKKLKKQCAGSGISFYSVKEKGALIIPL